MKQFKHIWLFKLEREFDIVFQECILIHESRFDESKIKESSNYSRLVQKGFRLHSFVIEKMPAFSWYVYTEDRPLGEKRQKAIDRYGLEIVSKAVDAYETMDDKNFWEDLDDYDRKEYFERMK